jgi:hypothetical protein
LTYLALLLGLDSRFVPIYANDFITMSAPSARVDFGVRQNEPKAREKGAERC